MREQDSLGNGPFVGSCRAHAHTDSAAPAVSCGSGRSSTSGELWKLSGHYQGINGHKIVYLTPY